MPQNRSWGVRIVYWLRRYIGLPFSLLCSLLWRSACVLKKETRLEIPESSHESYYQLSTLLKPVSSNIQRQISDTLSKKMLGGCVKWPGAKVITVSFQNHTLSTFTWIWLTLSLFCEISEGVFNSTRWWTSNKEAMWVSCDWTAVTAPLICKVSHSTVHDQHFESIDGNDVAEWNFFPAQLQSNQGSRRRERFLLLQPRVLVVKCILVWCLGSSRLAPLRRGWPLMGRMTRVINGYISNIETGVPLAVAGFGFHSGWFGNHARNLRPEF